uniref:Uncharacterized protein n=1 Tax=Anguilla anguilla TaxID=7936 RepID=A0A0E9TCT2_ANGAN
MDPIWIFKRNLNVCVNVPSLRGCKCLRWIWARYEAV